MQRLAIDYADTGFFSDTVLDYLAGNPALLPFHAYPPTTGAIPQVMESLAQHQQADRGLLVSCLESQYRHLEGRIPAQLADNIAALRGPDTFTVTTAHQLNLFGGPLYYILKIVNAIRVARDLQERYPQYRFVPAYWMGSEDHDFEEVNHTYLFGKRVTWNNYQGGCLGTYSTEGIAALIAQVKDIIRQGPHLDEIIGILEDSFTEPVLADAVRRFLMHLFGEDGLVVVDGNCPDLKRVFAPVIREELEKQTSDQLVGDTIARLEKAGYGAQANPRRINLFYAERRSRERIVRHGKGFLLADSERQFSREELLALVAEAPERFSPNVILRPLHQQLVLPNAAFIGGGSEVAYWLQLMDLMRHYRIHFPMLLLRTSALFLPAHALSRMEKLGIAKAEVFKDADLLKKEFALRQGEFDLELSRETEELSDLFARVARKAAEVDGSLEAFAAAEGQRAIHSLENISKRMIRAGKASHDQSMAQIDKLKEILFPEGGLQERRESFLPFYASGGRVWLRELTGMLDPFEGRFQLIF